jgi:hypothetical protein
MVMVLFLETTAANDAENQNFIIQDFHTSKNLQPACCFIAHSTNHEAHKMTVEEVYLFIIGNERIYRIE